MGRQTGEPRTGSNQDLPGGYNPLVNDQEVKKILDRQASIPEVKISYLTLFKGAPTKDLVILGISIIFAIVAGV